MFDIRPVPLSDPDVAAMIAEVQAFYTERYGGPDEGPVDAAEFAGPHGAFFAGYAGGVAVAMGGWRFRPGLTALGRAPAAEIKRMYVVASARRTGLARAMLAHLESTARTAGADVMILETGIKQHEAIALYESSGYLAVPAFGFYADSPHARYYGKPL